MQVILAEDETIIRMDIKRMLEEIGCQVVGECRDGAMAVKLAQKYRPDVVLMDIKMPGTDGLTATRIISQKMLACVVLLTSYSDSETINKAMASGALGYLVKPIEKEKLEPALKVAYHRFVEMRKLRTDIKSLSAAASDRLIISRAKIILQKQMGFNEAEAYKMLRKQSMQQRRKISEVAKDILAQNNLGSGK